MTDSKDVRRPVTPESASPATDGGHGFASRRGSDVGKEEIEAWLISKIAQKVSMSPHRVERHQPFSSFGIDSIAAVSLVGDMEEWTGCRLSPTLMYDYPNIEALARHVATELGV